MSRIQNDVLLAAAGLLHNCLKLKIFLIVAFVLSFLVKLLPVAMYGSLPNSEQLKVFWRAAKDTRKVIVATNIAETSITIPNIVYGTDIIKYFTRALLRSILSLMVLNSK